MLFSAANKRPIAMIRLLKKYVPTNIKDFLKNIVAIFLRLSRHGLNWRDSASNAIILSDGNNPTFFGYHDKTPFSLDGSKILAMSITASDTKPESECTPMKLGYFQKTNSGDFENRFIPFAETTTWCFQQGCMLQWHPLEPNRYVVFNALVDGNYGSKVFDISKGEEVRTYQYPIYSLDPTGKLAATLNFSRLGRLRPGYGYGLLPDHTQSDPAPEDDGLFVFDLASGERRLLVGIAALAREAGDPCSQHYINHATFSPDGNRLVFFHLWAKEGDRGRGLRVFEANPESGKWREVESERTVSHYCWRDPNIFIATTREKSGKWHYALYDLEEHTRVDINLPLKKDGHPMYHPTDKTQIVTDTYPDKRRDQHLFIVKLDAKKTERVASLFSSLRYHGQVRCDLHPRWDRVGEYVSIDTTHTSNRKLGLLNVRQLPNFQPLL
jgi:hypothetical protein